MNKYDAYTAMQKWCSYKLQSFVYHEDIRRMGQWYEKKHVGQIIKVREQVGIKNNLRQSVSTYFLSWPSKNKFRATCLQML